VPRPSPAATRVVDLLEFLASHPADSFRLSEIARRLDFNKATAHGMLAELATAGFLYYDDADKTFRLGPALVHLAQVAVDDDASVVRIAEPEMRALAEDVGAQCLANAIIGDQFMVLAAYGKASRGRGAFAGYRGLVVPPIGMIFYAWAAQSRVDGWLDRIGADARERARYRRLLQTVAERGYSISADQELRERLDRVVEELARVPEEEAREALNSIIGDLAGGDHELVEIAPERRYDTRQISAPVFDASGRVRIGLLLTGLPELTGSDLLGHARLLHDAAERVTEQVAGRDPEASLLAV
jgi:DNA-binding IclR family transcriptional regulator